MPYLVPILKQRAAETRTAFVNTLQEKKKKGSFYPLKVVFLWSYEGLKMSIKSS